MFARKLKQIVHEGRYGIYGIFQLPSPIGTRRVRYRLDWVAVLLQLHTGRFHGLRIKRDKSRSVHASCTQGSLVVQVGCRIYIPNWFVLANYRHPPKST